MKEIRVSINLPCALKAPSKGGNVIEMTKLLQPFKLLDPHCQGLELTRTKA